MVAADPPGKLINIALLHLKLLIHLVSSRVELVVQLQKLLAVERWQPQHLCFYKSSVSFRCLHSLEEVMSLRDTLLLRELIHFLQREKLPQERITRDNVSAAGSTGHSKYSKASQEEALFAKHFTFYVKNHCVGTIQSQF